MLKEFGSLFSFLTIFPLSYTNLETIARFMYLFPLVGLAIGLVIGAIGFGLSLFLDPLIVGLLVVISLILITGAHHTDGLGDFADGLMAKGTKEKKLNAMKDIAIGSGGIVAIVLYLIGLLVSISLLNGYNLFVSILLSETIAKFSMVLMATIGKSANIGSNTPFVKSMQDRKKIAIAGVITLIPLLVLGGLEGVYIFGAIVCMTLLLVALSSRCFGGVTGDVLGATNELTRLASLLIFASL